MRKLSLLLLLAFQARPANNFALTIDNIMRGPNLVGFEPTGVRWSHDSSTLYFQWKQYSDPIIAPMDTYAVNRDGGNLRKLSDDEIKLLPPAFGETTRDHRLAVYSNGGDLYLYDNTTGKQRQLTKTVDIEASPRFTRDEKRISYIHGDNLYVMSLDGSSPLVQLTEIRGAITGAPAAAPGGFGGGRGGRGGGGAAAPPTTSGTGAAEQKGTDSQEYLKKEQRELITVVRERVEQREALQKKHEKEPARKPFTLQQRQSIRSLQLTPDEKYVIASVFETPAAPAKNTIVPNYVTDSAYTEDIPGRSNVGDSQGTAKLAVINVESGEVKWADHGQKKDVGLSIPVWNEDGTKAVVAARSADNKDRWIFALDPATGKLRTLATLHDDAWVAGPASNTLGWMKNDRDVYFVSEKSGYAHLWSVNFDGGDPRQITTGNWEVAGVTQSRDKSKFYLTATADGPSDVYLYEISGEGGPLTRISKAPGRHTTTLSPDERYIADIYSYTNKPPDLYVQENRPQQELTRLTTSPSPEFAQYAWQDAPIVQVPARDGVKVPARMFKPANYKKGGPAVVFVHGAGYLQNVDHKWSTYFREYMFHHILEERGFLVLDVDYRGSAGYGRDWRTAIYQHMGGKDLDDIVDAAKYAVSAHGADPKKIGLYGGSYGGFITLMAMFTASDTFSAGAALRPVTDWATYNHGYTSDILNTPQADPEAYRRSSPIFFADGLKGALLICHGMVDTNVEFQDTVRLIQRLIELKKENWSVAPYPVEDHTFVQPSSWADEYKRILKLFETNLK
jgi:dipeptidyl aminopeptidase/acylaminoacyl peptidase